MPRPRSRAGSRPAAEALARTAPLVSRWIERLLAAHDPPLTVAQYLVLQAVGERELVGSELARRAAVPPAAVSQPLAALPDGHPPERIETRAEDLRACGAQVSAHVADLADRAQAVAFVAAARAAQGAIDVLVHAAGMVQTGRAPVSARFLDLSPEDLQRELELTLKT